MPQPIEKLMETADERIFALFVGDSGSGKTSTLPYFPGEKLDIDIDKRWKGLLGHKKQLPLKGMNIHHFKGNDISKEIDDLFTEYERMIERKQKFPYDLIAFDGFTSFDQLVCDDAIKFIGEVSGIRTADGKALTTGNKKFGEMDLMGWDAWAYELQAFKKIMTSLKYLFPCNVICTAHWTDRYEEGKIIGRDINLRKKILNQTLLWFDEIYFFDRKTSNELTQKGEQKTTTKFTVHFRNDIARTTYPLLPDKVDWTDKDFYKILMSGKRGEIKET